MLLDLFSNSFFPWFNILLIVDWHRKYFQVEKKFQMPEKDPKAVNEALSVCISSNITGRSDLVVIRK